MGFTCSQSFDTILSYYEGRLFLISAFFLGTSSMKILPQQFFYGKGSTPELRIFYTLTIMTCFSWLPAMSHETRTCKTGTAEVSHL